MRCHRARRAPPRFTDHQPLVNLHVCARLRHILMTRCVLYALSAALRLKGGGRGGGTESESIAPRRVRLRMCQGVFHPPPPCDNETSSSLRGSRGEWEWELWDRTNPFWGGGEKILRREAM